MGNALLLAVVACVSCGVPAADPLPAASVPALKFTVTLDRADYVHREGIFADWRLTNHGNVPIELINTYYAVEFYVRNGQGKLTALDDGVICGIGRRDAFTTLRPGEYLDGSIDLYNSFYGWSGPGTYTLEARFVASTANYGEKVNHMVRCPKCEFTIHPPQGDDAVAANLISQRMSKVATDGNRDTGPGVLRWSHGLTEELIKGKSARFTALAHLVSGLHLLPPWQLPNEPISEDGAFHAENHLRACLRSEGASPYMKALACCELVRLAKLTMPHVPRHEVIRMAQALSREFPNTFMAAQGVRILDQLQKSYK